MKYPKGKSGNPKGRAHESEQRKRIAADLLSDQVDIAVARIRESLSAPEREDHQWAVGLVMSYVFGKPAQAVELKGDESAPLVATITIGKQS